MTLKGGCHSLNFRNEFGWAGGPQMRRVADVSVAVANLGAAPLDCGSSRVRI
jgi:hypothetical protein